LHTVSTIRFHSDWTNELLTSTSAVLEAVNLKENLSDWGFGVFVWHLNCMVFWRLHGTFNYGNAHFEADGSAKSDLMRI
jgi:hypothetical protein